MKFIDIKIRFIGVLFLCMIYTLSMYSQNIRKRGETKPVDLSLKVTDEGGIAISKALVVIGEGSVHGETDESGKLLFSANPGDEITVAFPGYEKQTVSVDRMANNVTVKLVKTKVYMGIEDDTPLPYITLKKRFTTGGENVLSGEQLERYPSTDVRNGLTGLMTGLEVVEKYGITGLSSDRDATERVALRVRGQSPICIIDGVRSRMYEMQLDPSEIESVTLLKDVVSKAMYGPEAADGALLIKTKRGVRNERILNVNIESGVSKIDRMPSFVSGADYARLNNLARTNSNLAPLYTEEDIADYSKNDPYDLIHPSVDFKSLMLQDTKPFSRANVSSRGGNENVQYFANLLYEHEGDIYKMGPRAGFDKINARTNIDVKVNDVISTQFDIYAGLNIQKSPNYGYNLVDKYELNRVMDDITNISPIAFPIYAKNDASITEPWYGISNTFGNNPIGRLLEEGSYTETGRSGNFGLTLNYDMRNILKGLKSKTFINYQSLYVDRIGKETDYTAYIVTPGKTITGQDTASLTFGRSSVDASSQSRLYDYFYHRLTAYENLSYERALDKHAFQTMLSLFMSRTVYDGMEEPQRLLNGLWNGNYTYDDKYILQAVVNYAGSSTFKRGHRFRAFPSFGLGWVVSEEPFLSSVKFLDYLKLRANVGELGSEDFVSPYRTNTLYTYNTSLGTFGPAPTGYWFGTNRDYSGYQTYPSQTGNPDLSWEIRKECSLGLDALMFGRSLSLEVNYYNNKQSGIITQLSNTIPYMSGYSGADAYFNYNSTRYYGFEFGLNYSNKMGKLDYSIGGSATTRESEYLKLDEPNYRYQYQSRIGRPVDSYYGLVCLGQFASDEETQEVPQLYDDVLHAGDFKYIDMNGDGVVNDQDKCYIGHTIPQFVYSLNLRLGYKGFDLTLIGTGRAKYDIPLTNSYFWNGWGDNNYSRFVKDNNGGIYPRLTYYKVSNNYQASSFWLTHGDFFKIQNVELGYNIPSVLAKTLKTRSIRIFLRGANLLTISNVKDVDPENIDSGIASYPLYKTVTGGLKLTF